VVTWGLSWAEDWWGKQVYYAFADYPRLDLAVAEHGLRRGDKLAVHLCASGVVKVLANIEKAGWHIRCLRHGRRSRPHNEFS
jgi:hypothetical protein